MSERSVQLVGGSTYTLSLPKSWIASHGITPKSKLTVLETKSGTLVVVPPSTRKKSLEIKTGDDPDKAVKLDTAAYLNGYEKLSLRGEYEINQEVRSAVRNALRRLTGFEVTRETPSSLEVEAQVEPKRLSLETGLSRMKNLAISALELGFSGSQGSQIETLEQIDEDADRLNLFYTRILRQALLEPIELARLGMENAAVFDSLTVFRTLERCVDHAVSASKGWLQRTELQKKSEEVKKTSMLVGRTLEDAVTSFIKKNPDLATAVSKQKAELRGGVLELIDIHKKPSLLVYHLSRIVDYSSDIAELVLDEGYAFMNP